MVGDVAVVTRAEFSHILVKPTPNDGGQAPLVPTRRAEGRGAVTIAAPSALEAILGLPENKRVTVWL